MKEGLIKMKYVIELIDSSLFEDKEFEYKLNLESDKDRIEKWAKTLVGWYSCWNRPFIN